MNLSVVVLQRDPAAGQSLAAGLRSTFYAVDVAESCDDLRDKIVRQGAEAAVLDVEALRFAEIENLHRDFPALLLVCTHRVPDEEMWMAALTAGAVDVCAAHDVEAILASVLRNVTLAQSDAA